MGTAAAYYLAGAAAAPAGGALAALGVDPAPLRALLDDPSTAAALAFLRSPAGAAAVAGAGLPRDDRRRLLGLPAAADGLTARLAALDTAASAAAFAPAILQAKTVPCCIATAAAASFSTWYAVAAATALALAALVCALAGSAPPRGTGKADGREAGVVEVVARGASL